MNSSSSSPVYLMAKMNQDGSLTILNVNVYCNHKISYEIDLKFDKNGKILPYNGKESSSHAHMWEQASNRIMQRKQGEGNAHLEVLPDFLSLINAIEKFNLQKHHSKR